MSKKILAFILGMTAMTMATKAVNPCNWSDWTVINCPGISITDNTGSLGKVAPGDNIDISSVFTVSTTSGTRTRTSDNCGSETQNFEYTLTPSVTVYFDNGEGVVQPGDLSNLQAGTYYITNHFTAPSPDPACAAFDEKFTAKITVEGQCSADGCSSCFEGLSFSAITTKLDSLNVNMRLGKAIFGTKRAGTLSIYEDGPSADMATPKNLKFRGNSGFHEVIRNLDGSLRQVMAPDGLADIVPINDLKYEVRFYT